MLIAGHPKRPPPGKTNTFRDFWDPLPLIVDINNPLYQHSQLQPGRHASAKILLEVSLITILALSSRGIIYVTGLTGGLLCLWKQFLQVWQLLWPQNPPIFCSAQCLEKLGTMPRFKTLFHTNIPQVQDQDDKRNWICSFVVGGHDKERDHKGVTGSLVRVFNQGSLWKAKVFIKIQEFLKSAMLSKKIGLQ